MRQKIVLTGQNGLMCALNRVRGHYHSLRDTSGETSLDFFVAKRLVCLRLLNHASGRKSDGAVAYPLATSLCARHLLTPGVCIPAFVLSELLLFLYPFGVVLGFSFRVNPSIIFLLFRFLSQR